MTKGKTIAIGAGVAVVGVGAVLATSHPHRPVAKTVAAGHKAYHAAPKPSAAQKPAEKPAKTVPSVPKVPTIPSAGESSAVSAQAGLAALTHHEGVATPTGPIDIVPNLANPAQQWAFATESAQGQSTGYTLWFGERTGSGPWTWIPSTLPGALSHRLPPAVYSTLQWAYDLHEGQPLEGSLLGTVSWDAITGHVGEPEAWVAGASSLPHGQMLVITVWEKSYTGSYSGYYGVQSGVVQEHDCRRPVGVIRDCAGREPNLKPIGQEAESVTRRC